jgi:pimeloyl-ACP methyl ester carboxylesterase
MLINNHHIHVETYEPDGGPLVVFLHHGLGSTQAWQGQLGAFASAGLRVIAYDRWGYGQSDPRPHLSVPGFEDDLADLQTLLSTLGSPLTTLVGHSDGGTIALYYASQNPERVAALVTVAAHIYLEPRMEPSVLKIKQAFEHDSRFRNGMRRIHGEKFESTFYNWFDGWFQSPALEWDLRPLLRKIQCPVLVIQGEEDEHATPQHAIDIADSIPNAQLWSVPGARHMLPKDVAETFNRKVLEFINLNVTM